MEPGVLVAIGGAIGAALRFAVGEVVGPTEFPVATLLVNVLGSFVLGLLAFGGASDEVTLFLGVGACGAFTTYSSFSVQTVLLFEAGNRGKAIANAASNLCFCVGAIWIAWWLVG